MSIPPTQYFDLGSWQSWNFMDWSDGKIDINKLNDYLDSFAKQCHDQGLSEVIFSFGQAKDLRDLIQGDFKDCSPDSSLYMLFKATGGATANGQNLFQYIVQRLNQDGVGSALSFGGSNAGTKDPEDWDFGFSNSYSPKQAADSLAKWAKEIGLNEIDFDIEGGAEKIAQMNTPSDLAEFFTELHSQSKASGIINELTIMGDTNKWGITGPNSYLSPIFQHGKLNEMFDGVNLMLYNGQYYLNAGQQPLESWDLTIWVNDLMKNTGLSAEQCVNMLHLGFYSGKIQYNDPSYSGGPLPFQNMPKGLSNGQAAAYIYLQLQDALRKIYNDTSITLPTPFFWNDNADYTVDSGVSHFFDKGNNFEKDFNSYVLKNMGKAKG